MAVGKVYDTEELGRIEKILNEQTTLLQQVDKEKQFGNKKVLQYTLVVAGIVILLFGFKFALDKN
jgi:preprotein translocase subunit SecE